MAAVTQPIRVLPVDDHAVAREGIRMMLSGEQDIVVVGEASSGEEAIQRVHELAPHVVLMDIRMPGMSGIEATRRIKSTSPATSVIMLTMFDSNTYVVEAIQAGAAGYLTKDVSREILCHAIRSAVNGGTVVSSNLLKRAIQAISRAPVGRRERSDTPLLAERLTPREMDVLRLVAQGYGNKEIREELGLAEITVKKYVQTIIQKLGVSDRTQAAIQAARLGLVE